MSNLDSYLSALTCPLRQEGASGLPGADAPGAFLASEQNPVLLPFEEDRLRITLCAPVRRLQQKTQVFPLDVRTSSRSRLTHSLEVQVYLRHLMQLLCRKTPPLTPYAAALTVLCENAALLHDIGNPPFGHFGECLTAKFTGKAAAERASELSESEREDLSFFNGNAQGLRLVTTIQRLNLTLGQLSAMMKYPQTYAEKVSGRGVAAWESFYRKLRCFCVYAGSGVRRTSILSPLSWSFATISHMSLLIWRMPSITACSPMPLSTPLPRT